MYKHKHIICTEADEEIYRKQCVALEKSIPGIIKMDEKCDIDDSRIQLYTLNGKKIAVINDVGAGLVRLNSDIPLEPFFEKSKRKRRLQRAPASAPVVAQNAASAETQLA